MKGHSGLILAIMTRIIILWKGQSIKDVRTFSVIFGLLPHPPCPHPSTLTALSTPVRADTNFEHDAELFSKRINIYLEIIYGNREKTIYFKELIYCPVWTYQRTLLNKCRFLSVGQFDKNLGQHLMVIVFRGI